MCILDKKNTLITLIIKARLPRKNNKKEMLTNVIYHAIIIRRLKVNLHIPITQHALMAQAVERRLGKAEATGSSPVESL